MRTEELIVQLARSAGPIEPLAPPLQRLWRWTAGSLAATAAGVAVIGVRADSGAMLHQMAFLAMAALIVATALAAAGMALVLSVPGAERSAVQRWTPIVIGGAWAAWLAASVLSGGSAVARIAAFPVHVGCVVQITALAAGPAWGLFVMLRRAAVLRRHWAAGLASLAALAIGAAGTQFLCPINDPAHLLVGHFVPVFGLAVAGAMIGTRALTD